MTLFKAADEKGKSGDGAARGERSANGAEDEAEGYEYDGSADGFALDGSAGQTVEEDERYQNRHVLIHNAWPPVCVGSRISEPSVIVRRFSGFCQFNRANSGRAWGRGGGWIFGFTIFELRFTIWKGGGR
jgi:hypothetical protein